MGWDEPFWRHQYDLWRGTIRSGLKSRRVIQLHYAPNRAECWGSFKLPPSSQLQNMQECNEKGNQFTLESKCSLVWNLTKILAFFFKHIEVKCLLFQTWFYWFKHLMEWNHLTSTEGNFPTHSKGDKTQTLTWLFLSAEHLFFLVISFYDTKLMDTSTFIMSLISDKRASVWIKRKKCDVSDVVNCDGYDRDAAKSISAASAAGRLSTSCRHVRPSGNEAASAAGCCPSAPDPSPSFCTGEKCPRQRVSQQLWLSTFFLSLSNINTIQIR